jgi:cobalt/nickel transport system permease protein/cobalt/nickel transport protein
MRNRVFLATGLLVALLVAGLGSYYASGQPDGLNRVAEQTGFDHTQEDSATADAPFAGYRTSGVGDDRLSGGLAGVAGVLMVGVLGGGLFWALRRRDGDDAPDHRDS